MGAWKGEILDIYNADVRVEIISGVKQVISHVITGAVTLGIMVAIRRIWPPHVPPPIHLDEVTDSTTRSVRIGCWSPSAPRE